MKLRHSIAAAVLLASAFTPGVSLAQMEPLSDPVIAHSDPESLFTSPDPKLHRNKQSALAIVKILLEAGHWERAPEFLTPRYIQHNPLASSGLNGVMNFFINVAKVSPTPIPSRMQTKVVAVQAEGDYVTVVYLRELPLPGDPSRTYTTSWFDTWRFVNGKADEHWDPATLSAAAPSQAVTATDGEVLSDRDRADIEKLMWNYARAIDTWNVDAFASAFTEDGAFGTVRGREALKEFVRGFVRARGEQAERGEEVPTLHHYMSNAWVEFVSRDRARYHYYWTTVFIYKSPKPPMIFAAGNGVDDLVRVDGKWLISHRDVTPTGD